MMKKLLLILLIFSGYAISAEQENNPFFESEKNNTKTEVKTENSYKAAKGPGNPDNDPDLPIDDYIPFLVITAVAMISYRTYRKRSVIS